MNSYYSENEYVYDRNYLKRVRRGISGKIFSHSNRMIESPFKSDQYFSKVLELGATDTYHSTFVKHDFDLYLVSDRVFNFKPEVKDNRFQIIQLDANDLGRFEESTFDRVIATCLIVHLNDIPHALYEWRRVCKNDGYISIHVHCEPGLLLRFSRLLHSLKERLRLRDHWDTVYSEHVSYYLHVKTSIDRVFENDEIKSSSFPIPGLTWNLSFWKIFTIKVKKL